MRLCQRSCPNNHPKCFAFFGLGDLMIASIFPGSSAMASLLTMCPSSTLLVTPNAHLAGFKRSQLAHRLASSATNTGPISLRVENLVIDMRTRRRTHVVRLCKLKNNGVFSRVHRAVWNSPNFDTSPLRQICTISPSSTFTSMEAKESHISFIFEV